MSSCFAIDISLVFAVEEDTAFDPIVNVNDTAGGATEGRLVGLRVGYRVGLTVGLPATAEAFITGILLSSEFVVSLRAILPFTSFNMFNSGESRLLLLKDTPQTDVWSDVTSDTSVADTPIALLTANPIMSLTTG